MKASFRTLTNQPTTGTVMLDYTNMSMQDLVDLLAQNTQRFTRLMTDKSFNEEYIKCKNIIQQILTQIKLRKESLASSNDQDTAINHPDHLGKI